MVHFFTENSLTIFDIHCPVHEARLSKPWLTETIKDMIKSRAEAYKRFENSQYAHWNYYKQLRNYVNAAILREKKVYVESASRQNNSGITWNRLRILKIVGQKNSELKNAQDIN
ncbi:hypothetical protein JTB14_021070 [Gonioctena quinquepunctata]|nr:hypothetical protein JTB14_021070 [Gonioctena quinquepunctata]